MEIQAKEVIAESVSTTVPTVMVTGIFDSEKGQGKNVQVKWLTKRKGSLGLVNLFLGKLATQNIEKRTALQFMENEVVEQLGIKEGINLNNAMVKAGHSPVRISISEISNEDYKEFEAQGMNMFGYQQKINPSTGEVIGFEGAPIWRKTFIDVVDGKDDYLPTDRSTVTFQESEVTV